MNVEEFVLLVWNLWSGHFFSFDARVFIEDNESYYFASSGVHSVTNDIYTSHPIFIWNHTNLVPHNLSSCQLMTFVLLWWKVAGNWIKCSQLNWKISSKCNIVSCFNENALKQFGDIPVLSHIHWNRKQRSLFIGDKF